MFNKQKVTYYNNIHINERVNKSTRRLEEYPNKRAIVNK